MSRSFLLFPFRSYLSRLYTHSLYISTHFNLWASCFLPPLPLPLIFLSTVHVLFHLSTTIYPHPLKLPFTFFFHFWVSRFNPVNLPSLSFSFDPTLPDVFKYVISWDTPEPLLLHHPFKYFLFLPELLHHPFKYFLLVSPWTSLGDSCTYLSRLRRIWKRRSSSVVDANVDVIRVAEVELRSVKMSARLATDSLAWPIPLLWAHITMNVWNACTRSDVCILSFTFIISYQLNEYSYYGSIN